MGSQEINRTPQKQTIQPGQRVDQKSGCC